MMKKVIILIKYAKNIKNKNNKMHNFVLMEGI